jgi:hypothetical protein
MYCIEIYRGERQITFTFPKHIRLPALLSPAQPSVNSGDHLELSKYEEELKLGTISPGTSPRPTSTTRRAPPSKLTYVTYPYATMLSSLTEAKFDIDQSLKRFLFYDFGTSLSAKSK